jgi:hypothetical protein
MGKGVGHDVLLLSKIYVITTHTDSEGTDFIFPLYAGDRMIFAKKPRKKFSPLRVAEKFNLSPGLNRVHNQQEVDSL